MSRPVSPRRKARTPCFSFRREARSEFSTRGAIGFTPICLTICKAGSRRGAPRWCGYSNCRTYEICFPQKDAEEHRKFEFLVFSALSAVKIPAAVEKNAKAFHLDS